MRERVLSYIRRRELMRPGDRVGVAVSGGADSVALLRLLLEARAELGIVLSAVHFNHKIRGAEADADERFVRQLARAFDLQFHCDFADTPFYARDRQISLEAAGRKLRYAFFDRLIASNTLTRVATAHTRDDQAETVLMRFLRGSGTRGLAGIYPNVGGWMASAEGQALPPEPRIVRPLLEVSRAELRAGLEAAGQSWREDATNADLSLARNRLRHEMLPLLRGLNPNLDETLGEMAEIARGEEDYWDEQVRRLLPSVQSPSAAGERESALLVSALREHPLALERRLLRLAAQLQGLRLEFRHVEDVLALAAAEPCRSERLIELPHGWEAVRSGAELWFRNRSLISKEPRAYDLHLPVPGEAQAAGRRIRASLLASAAEFAQARVTEGQVLLDPALASAALRVRNWRPGDRYWPAHTRGPKKLKELLLAPHVPRAQKPFWPVVVSGEEIVWVPGFAPPERFRVRDESPAALLLEEVPAPSEGENGPS